MTRDALLQPFKLKHLTLRNRIVSTAHEPAYTDEHGMPAERYRLYQKEKVKGGVGLTMIGGSAVVSKDSPDAFGNIDMSTDDVIPYLRAIADDCHEAGVPVMTQLTHLGMRSSSYEGSWLPLISPSRVREPGHRSFTKAMEDHDIERVIEDFAAAARRAHQGGLDGVEIFHAGHMLSAFINENWNTRDDEYGGSLENRMRFPVRVIDAVRAAVPDDFIVSLRMNVQDRRPEGINSDMAVQIASVYADHGVDLLNIVMGFIENDRELSEHIPGMGTPSAPGLELCRRIREHVSIPVLHATRIADAPTARHAIERGMLDLVGMTRAQLADPYLVQKITEKREDDIRPCVGANMCLDAIYTSGSAVCVHNPATGREETLPQKLSDAPAPRRSRKVVIVGAGPAGLEAARVCAARGHDVTVLEADSTYGGQVRIAASSERRRDLIGIVDWRFQQAKKHGATFLFNRYAEPEDVAGFSPDVVIIATGGVPDSDYGDNRAQVFDVWDVLQGGLKDRKRVMVFDDHGQYPSLDAVEHLAKAGHEVTYVTPERTIGIDVGAMNNPAYLKVFSRYGVKTILGERLTATRPGENRNETVVTLRNEYSDLETEITVDGVVIDHGTVPVDDVYFGLRDASSNKGAVDQAAFIRGGAQPIPEMLDDDPSFQLFRVGDAVASRNIHSAILDSLRIGLGV